LQNASTSTSTSTSSYRNDLSAETSLIFIIEMSSNINPLLVQNRAQLVAQLQARQARINAHHIHRIQVAQHARQLAALAAANPNINPALIFQTFGGGNITIPNPALQPPNPQQPMWPGQLTFQQVQQNHFQQLQQPTVQQPILQNAVVQNAVVQNHVLPHVPAIQNAAAANPAVPSQVNST
jgi:hypothetical protein